MMKKQALPVFNLILLLYLCSVDISAQLPFIRYDLNQISLPADSAAWFKFAGTFRDVKEQGKGTLNILHIGDSHIQGDYFTGQVRKNLFQYLQVDMQSRGMAFPYYIAGTNGPDELFSKSTGCLERYAVRKQPKRYFPFQGYSISACDTLNIYLDDTSGYRFNEAFVFHSPAGVKQLKLNNSCNGKTQTISDSLQVTSFCFENIQQNLHLEIIPNAFKPSLYGFYLVNNQNRILCNSLGINGATYGTFLQMQDQKELLKFMKPDCIVISYGTNDALSRNLDTAQLRKQIGQSITLIREALPGIPVILTTPGDYLLNKKYVNPRTAVVGKLIREMAVEHNCASWDFYHIMGGPGSVRAWYSSQLMFKDMIHLSKKGYRLQGDLFFSALLNLSSIQKR